MSSRSGTINISLTNLSTTADFFFIYLYGVEKSCCEQSELAQAIPALGREVGSDDLYKSLPTHTVLWLCELVLPTCSFVSLEIHKFYFNKLFVLPPNTEQNTSSVFRP